MHACMYACMYIVCMYVSAVSVQARRVLQPPLRWHRHRRRRLYDRVWQRQLSRASVGLSCNLPHVKLQDHVGNDKQLACVRLLLHF
jgi:hypothetical protein